MYLGSAWYPEQWPEERWKRDLELMREAGMNVARIGEYSWSRSESKEGQIDLDWLERAVNLAAQYGVQIVMGTPCDAPPAWLTKKYPEVLRVDEQGRRTQHGARRHFSPFSTKYRELCAGMAEVMAKRFGHNQNVIGWQIGNEFCQYTYDENTRTLFQQWLKRKYGTLENLNQHWTGHYWSEAYSDWSEIVLPIGWPNPGLFLAYFHFMSEGFAEFQQVQIDAIRRHADSRQWITHNIHGWEDLDFIKIIEGADVASWDPYPGTHPVQGEYFGWTSDFCRTIKPRKHWIIEAQPGNVNWASPNLTLAKGAIRAMAWHFYAHGAEALLFWQWRSGLGGQEQYHGTLVAPDGEPRAIYPEVARVGRELRAAEGLLKDATARAQVAVLYSYADQVVLKAQRHNHDFDALRHTRAFYAPLRRMALEVDVLDVSRDVAAYPLVVAPHLHILNDRVVEKLAAYVKAGGHLVLGPRSGFKDEHNAMLPSRQPGKVLAELLGAHVDEFYTTDRPVEATGELGAVMLSTWAEVLKVDAPDAKVLLRYAPFNGWIDNQPAMVTRAVGKGRITYLGAWLDSEGMQLAMRWCASVSGVKAELPEPPDGVEVCTRWTGEQQINILINHSATTQRVTLPRAMKNVLGGGEVRELELPPYEVAILV